MYEIFTHDDNKKSREMLHDELWYSKSAYFLENLDKLKFNMKGKKENILTLTYNKLHAFKDKVLVKNEGNFSLFSKTCASSKYSNIKE